MKLPILTLFSVGILCTSASFAAQNSPASTKTTSTAPHTVLTTEKDKISYSIGADLGTSFKAQNIDINPVILTQGLQDATNNHLLMSKEDMTNTLNTLQKTLVKKHEAQMQTNATDNLTKGKAYLEANKQKPGVITTASGLQYKVINAGKGDNPTAADTVTVDYKGTFINGKVFDSSYDRKKSATFPLSAVIPGWQEALKLMKPGATYEVVIPADLAYGAQGAGAAVGPNETLLFTIHLVAVKKAG